MIILQSSFNRIQQTNKIATIYDSYIYIRVS